MKAITLTTPGGIENLVTIELPIPAIQPDEVLVQVVSLSINPVDVKTRKGKGMYGSLQQHQPLVLGWDISGVITATGTNVHNFKTGDAVFGMVNFPGHGQAYAEYVAVPANQLALKPANISHEEAAAATLAALTAYQALVTHANIKQGDRILIHAAAGGVGHYAVQIAKHLGAHVTGTASAANRDFLLSLGADAHIDYQNQDFTKELRDIDYVLESLGGDMIDRSLEVIRPGGSINSIPSGLPEDITAKAAAKNIHAYRTMVYSSGEHMEVLADWLEKGIIKSTVSQTFGFADIPQAHLQIETGKTRGKVIVNV
ncbi:NADP-dependent oxidoreductase [Chitinophaga horti]|uniref:NADP-dependent oxidoreductase n=1 Tax=Chitinophaga horti TaxID=2920382 RepID=A0ABY6J2I9_9BACT|nr:NADP-dependent oxidoreductase [Chitinophaga horti]UYQ92372.1 NADP-dependent oxidoreductase [Chitinophaga horti]